MNLSISNDHSFDLLPLSKAQLSNIQQLGYLKMTPIQQKALPYILDGKDICAKANTGSGKTAAFGIGVLEFIAVDRAETQCLVLCPTRELAAQVSTELRKLARFLPNLKVLTLCGGTAKYPQKIALQQPPHIVVGTPGRILDHLSKDHLKLDFLKCLVLDEADRMLDMGFSDELDELMDYVPDNRQTLLFSASYPSHIEQMSKRVQTDPIHISIDSDIAPLHIEQVFLNVSKALRVNTLISILKYYQPDSCIVFCNTKNDTTLVALALTDLGMSVAVLNGDLDQRERDQVMLRFKNGSCRILVATDVAARGIDIKALSLVVNYDMAHNSDTYVHRIGRTGRAGLQGRAITFCNDYDQDKLHDIADHFQEKINWGDVSVYQTRKENAVLFSKMRTLRIASGKKEKIRPGDLLGALTASGGLLASAIGKIDVFDKYSCVAIVDDQALLALKILQSNKIKGRSIKVSFLD